MGFGDMVEAGWSVVQPTLDVWKALPPRHFPNYAAGWWGPKEADDLIGGDVEVGGSVAVGSAGDLVAGSFP